MRGIEGTSSSSHDGERRREKEPDSMRQSLLRARIAKLPHLPAIAPHSLRSPFDEPAEEGQEEQAEEEDGEQDGLGALGMPPPKNGPRRGRLARQGENEFSALSAEDCFQHALEVQIERRCPSVGSHADSNDGSTTATDVFRVYYTPAQGRQQPSTSSIGIPPIDGEGASNVAQQGTGHANDSGDDDGGNETVFVFHHGAGYSALSFALTAKSITQQTDGKAGVLAYDCRGHGKSTHSDAGASRQLSLEMLTQDGLSILKKMFPSDKKQPTLILVGHSMGGAVVVSMAHALKDDAKAATGAGETRHRPRVAGVAVLDVVEGTAMEALPGMKLIVSQLPKGFRSIPDAIRWHVESGTIVNLESARRSVPSLLRLREGADEGQVAVTEESEPMEELLSTDADRDAAAAADSATNEVVYPYVWRHDLMATEPFWSGWFQGLSKAFLSVPCARLLVLAGTDRLDKELMIGQMQGKYQLVVFPEVGHSLQEDAPQKTAQTLIEFWQRNEIVDVQSIRGLRKVGQ